MAEIRLIRRSWFQFSLRTLLIVTIFVGLGCAWIGMQLQQKRRHEALVKAILKSGGTMGISKDRDVPAWKEWLFGTYAVRRIELDLMSTKDTDLLLSQTQGMNLIFVRLHSSEATDAGLAFLKVTTSLEELVLDATRITDAGLAHVKGLTRLKKLCLRNTQVTDAGLNHLTGLTNLESLILEYVPITDGGLAHLTGLTKLNHLDLRDTQITDAGLKHLEGLTSLKELIIVNTQVTQAGIDNHQKVIPKYPIIYSAVRVAE